MKRALPLLILLMLAAASTGCAHDEVARTGGKVTLVADEGPPDAFTIKRTTLDHALAQGASWFIRQIGVRPVVTGDERFYGFQLMSIFPTNQPSGPLPIHVGDIVQSINGSPIERPEQFMEVWTSLAKASHLSIRIVRNGQPLLVTWAVEDDRAAPALSAARP